MAGFKNDGLYLELISTPAFPLAGHVTIYAANDGTINAIDSAGNVVRLDNAALEVAVALISSSYTTLVTTSDISAYLLGLLTSETNARTAADLSIRSDMVSVSGTLQSEIDSEVSARTAADTTLQNNIDSLNSIVVATSGNLQSNIDSEAAARASADAYLQSEITSLSAAAGDGAAALATELVSVSGYLQSEILTLSGGLATEITNRIAGDNALTAYANSITASLALEISNRLAEDTLLESEIIAASGNLQFAITTVANDLATEITDRQAADAAIEVELAGVSGTLQSEIDAESTARAAAVTALHSEVDTVSAGLAQEILDRIAGDATVHAYVDTVSGNIMGAVSSVQSDLAADVANLANNYYNKTVSDGRFVHLTGSEIISGAKTFANDLTAAGNLTVNGDLHVAGTTTTVDSSNVVVSDNIITLNQGETGAGVTLGEAGLTVDRGTSPNANLVFDETTDRWSVSLGDVSANPALSELAYVSEVNALRSDVMDTSAYLQSEIDALSTSSAGDLAAFEATVANLTASIESDIASEATARIAADTTLQSNIDAEATARIAGDNFLQTELVNVSGALNSAISAEAATRSAADIAVNAYVNSVSAALDLEISNRLAEDTAILAEIISVSGALQYEIDNITVDTTAIEARIDTISGDLITEIAARIAGDADLQSQLLAVSGTLQSEIVSVSGNLQSEIDAITADLVPILKGSIACDTINNIYTVTHTAVTNNQPVVSLVIPSGADAIFVQGVFNITSTGFQVALSDVPSVSGYRINYFTTSNSGSVQVINAAGMAGTFTKVTTNSFGQVTAGTQADLWDIHNVYKLTAATTDATETEMFVLGVTNSRMAVPSNKAWTFSALITGKRTDTTSVAAGYKIEGYIDNSMGVVDLFMSEMKTVFGEVDAAWDVNVYADNTNSALVFKVTGEAGANINWTAVVTVVEA